MRQANKIRDIIANQVAGLVKPEHTDNEHWYRYVKNGELYPSVTTRHSLLAMPHLKRWAANLAVDHIYDHVDENGLLDVPDLGKLKREALIQHSSVLKDAADIGTRGHEIVEDYLHERIETGKYRDDITTLIPDGADSRLHAIARSAEQFIKDYHVIPLAPELRVAHGTKQYAGTLDLLCFVGHMTEPREVDGCEHKFWLESKSKSLYRCDRCNKQIKYKLTMLDWKTSNQVLKPRYAMQASDYTYALRWMTDDAVKPNDIVIVQLDKKNKKYTMVSPTSAYDAHRMSMKLGPVYRWLNNGETKIEKVNKKEQVSLFDDVPENDESSGGLTKVTA